ncbi:MULTISPECIES: peptidylprolyl isomerase [unclassified Devosia]|uniref:peptidylprolyl isomerase n=1 Tax=unclassified Devosia TaxID=196773 RepID=UPI00145F5998|nr:MULTISPECIES: peptidylprolyl isomerase [unclassified Devosia]MBJ6985942.1 peptidylprolyl isomerase [Devosia sp. MC521]MBJ7579035.1 peptidylprolyl isomerase [Devosia sp. MC532]MBK1793428.1 peptidylprolyl isomerase [Devosia sp. WQ 349K1]
MITRRTFAALALSVSLVAAPAFAQEGKPHLILTLEDGVVDIELLPELAPKHVERIVELTKRGDYDGVVFHRVIDGFMAQTGDVQFGKTEGAEFNLGRAGMGGSDLPDVEAEFNKESFQRGIVGAARSSDPNSFNSQFFITYADASFLDNQYTVFGKVASGMELVDALEKGNQSNNGSVANPDKIIDAEIEYK